MTDPSMNDASQNERLDEILAGYLESERSGQRLDRQRLLAENTDLADELQAFFADHDRMKAVAEPLRVADASNSESVAEAATLMPHREPASPTDESSLPPTEADVLAGQRGKNSSARPGSVIRYFGDYELLSEIARGGMGVVYKARQVKLNRVVAMKMILAGQLASQEDVRRFYVEAEAAAKLSHPNIVPIFEVGLHEQQHYFSMAFVDGQSLAHRITQGVLEPREAARLLKDVASAIAYAHHEGVIHRDLKPGNILIDKDGTPRVTDFGLAKRVEGEASGLTVTGQILGTPSYMPPEQARGESAEVSQLSDVYSLGAVLYCLVTGRPPFQASNAVDTLLQVMSREPVSPRQLNASVPLDLETIILKCLEKKPSQRYASAQHLVDELTRFLEGRPILARPVSAAERGWRLCRRHPAIAVLTAGIAASLVICTLVSWSFARQADQQAREARRSENKAVSEKERADAAAADALDSAAKERSAKEAEKVARERAETLAASEAQARLAEEKQRREAQRLAQAEAQARANEERQRRHAERLAAETVLNRALDYCRRGEVNTGLLWLGRAMQLAPHDDIDLQQAIRFNLSYWGNQPPRLRSVRQLDAPVHSFSPNGEFVLTVDERDTKAHVLRVCRTLTGEAVGPPVSHDGPVTVVAFSTDGSVLAAGGSSGAVSIWNVATGHPHCKPVRHEKPIKAVALSGDGALLMTGGDDNTARVWDTATGKPLTPPLKHERWVESVAISPDTKTVMTGSQDYSARLWNVATGEPIGPPLKHTNWVWIVAFSPDSKAAASGSSDGTARLWNAQTGEPIGAPLRHGGIVRAVPFSPDGKVIVTGGSNEVARIWDAATGIPLSAPLPHAVITSRIAFHPDGRAFVAAGSKMAFTTLHGMARMWSIDGEPLSPPLPHPQVAAVAFADDGKVFVSASRSVVRIWDLHDETPIATPIRAIRHGNWISAVTFHRDGETILTGCVDGTGQLWDAATGMAKAPSFKHVNGSLENQRAVWDVAFSSDGRLAATASHDGTVRTWDAVTGASVGNTLLHWRPNSSGGPMVWSVAFSPNNKTLATGTGSGAAVGIGDTSIRFWDLDSGQQMGEPIKLGGGVRRLAFSLDGSLLASACMDGTAQLWDAATRQTVGPVMKHQADVRAVAFTPDGKMLVTGSEDGSARRWDVATGKQLGDPLEHDGAVAAVAVDPSGMLIATGSHDQTVRLWHATTGILVGQPLKHSGQALAVAFSRDGRTLLTGGTDRHARLWRVVEPLDGDPDTISTWAELRTGTQLTPAGTIRVLEADEWNERRVRRNAK